MPLPHLAPMVTSQHGGFGCAFPRPWSRFGSFVVEAEDAFCGIPKRRAYFSTRAVEKDIAGDGKMWKEQPTRRKALPGQS